MFVLAVSLYGRTEMMPFALASETQLLAFEYSNRVYVFDTNECMVSAEIYPELFFKVINPVRTYREGV
jgi:hypothetical protein